MPLIQRLSESRRDISLSTIVQCNEGSSPGFTKIGPTKDENAKNEQEALYQSSWKPLSSGSPSVTVVQSDAISTKAA